MDISGVIAMFAAILAASGFFLFLGTVGLKGEKKEDEYRSRCNWPHRKSHHASLQVYKAPCSPMSSGTGLRPKSIRRSTKRRSPRSIVPWPRRLRKGCAARVSRLPSSAAPGEALAAADGAGPFPSVPLEELHGPLMLLGGGERLEGAQVLALARALVLLPGVEAVSTRLELADHAAQHGHRVRDCHPGRRD